MRRPIKFRAWNALEQKILCPVAVNDQGFPYIWDDRFLQLIQMPSTYYHDGIVPPVMQFTGLHDKNGKEIYEGDIVRIENFLTHWETEPPIDWRIFEIIYNQYTWNLRNPYISTPLADYDTKTLEPWHIETIGNIFENPDLLEKK